MRAEQQVVAGRRLKESAGEEFPYVTEISPEDEAWLLEQHASMAKTITATKWWTNHTGWLVLTLCLLVSLVLTVNKSWWFLLSFPLAFLASLVIQQILVKVFVAVASGRVANEGNEITWPGNLFLFLVVPVVLLAHLLGKI